ncbi:hypothetical protein [Streptomyces sp. NPDC057877]|uniref:hypothetical protein n=1 Tax=Streptomyces sp. NPDC057877 TaxID=3346269 RepID=UPI0036954ACC
MNPKPPASTVAEIAEDPRSGMLLIPAHDPEYSHGVGLWDDARDVYRAFVRGSAVEGWEKGVLRAKVAGRSRKQMVLPVVVQLVPRPDNDHNPGAISVAAPVSMGGTDHERHMGYMYERQLVSLGAPLRTLAAVAERPVGCHALVEVDQADIDIEDEDDDEDEDDGGVLVVGVRQAYSLSSLRLRLPWWEDLQRMVIAYARTVRPELILPFVGHWTSYGEGAHAELLRRTGDKEFAVTLRARNGKLRAWYEDLELSVLVPSGRDFFDRTLRRVEELGGTAVARAEEHRGSLKVFVEDSSPPTIAGHGLA